MQLGTIGSSLVSVALTIIAALIVLFIGWIIARVISGVVHQLLMRTRLHKQFNDGLSQSGVSQQPDAAQWIASIAFWIIMLFVLAAFFEILNLTFVSQLLSGLLSIFFAYVPRLLAAGILVLIALVVAKLGRTVVFRVLSGLRVDQRVMKQASGTEPAGTPIATSVSEIVYWLIWLLFLPVILQALNMTSLLGPVQSMIDKIATFLPALAAAAVILVVGVFVAQILRRIVQGILVSIGLDRLGARLGLGRQEGAVTLSSLVGMLVYLLVLIPVITAALDAVGLTALTAPLTAMLNELIGAVPNILAAALILVVAYVVGRLVADLVRSLLATIGVDDWLARIGLTGPMVEGRVKLSQIIGTLVLAAIMVGAAMEAAAFLNFPALSALISGFVVFAAHVLLGLIIIGLGMWLANLASQAILASGQKQAGLTALLARMAIIIFAVAMGLQQMGLADAIVNIAFGLALGAVAVAAAIAFGWGGHEIANSELSGWVDRVKDGPIIPPPAALPPTSPTSPTTPPPTPPARPPAE